MEDGSRAHPLPRFLKLNCRAQHVYMCIFRNLRSLARGQNGELSAFERINFGPYEKKSRSKKMVSHTLRRVTGAALREAPSASKHVPLLAPVSPASIIETG